MKTLTIKTIEDKIGELEILSRSITEDDIDLALQGIIDSVKLADELNKVYMKLSAYLDSLKSKEVFTLKELKEFQDMEKALEEIEKQKMKLANARDSLSTAISYVVPKVKERFKLKTESFIVEFLGNEIIKIERA